MLITCGYTPKKVTRTKTKPKNISLRNAFICGKSLKNDEMSDGVNTV